MARNAIESDFRTSKMAAGILYKNKIKQFIDKMARNVIQREFRIWPTADILLKISKQIKVAYRSEMARNAIESQFRASKMGAGSHFVK